MPRGRGKNNQTRELFSLPFREKGLIPLRTYLRTFKVGDYVDIKVHSAQQKGMPHKWYTGKTGIIWNVSKRAVGIEVNKQVGNRIRKKRIHLRLEHVRQSRCREDFLKRREANEQLKAEAKQKKERLVKGSMKRQPVGPREGFTLAKPAVETVAPIPYDVLKEGVLS